MGLLSERYADGVITLVMGIYESCRALGIDFRSVELSDWLMFQQSSLEYPSRNITLKPNYEFHITTIRFNGSIDRVVVKPTIPRSYEKLLGAITTKRVGYMGRVVVKDYGVRGNQLWVRGEVHITIPLDVYYEHMARHRRNAGKLIGGVDVNTDRVNLAIVDEGGDLRDYKTFWFSEVTARGFPRHSAWSIIGMRIHEMLNYAYHHGVRILFLENPDILGRLKLMWVRSGDRKHENYDYKVSVFRSSIIERIALKAPLYSIETKYVNPKGTTNSTKHDETMRKYGLDRHTTSAYLTALKGLNTNKYEQPQIIIKTETALGYLTMQQLLEIDPATYGMTPACDLPLNELTTVTTKARIIDVLRRFRGFEDPVIGVVNDDGVLVATIYERELLRLLITV